MIIYMAFPGRYKKVQFTIFFCVVCFYFLNKFLLKIINFFPYEYMFIVTISHLALSVKGNQNGYKIFFDEEEAVTINMKALLNYL